MAYIGERTSLLALAALAGLYLATVLPNLADDPIAGGDEGWIISASAQLAQDGIFGSADKCADDPEDKDGNADDDGCPDLDDDEDGVPDLMDRCPAEKETANGYQDDDGCADTVPEAVLKFTGVIEGITFKKDSDEIKPASYKILQRAVKVMKDYPDVKIEISGHTSSEGEHDYNVDLSKRRAERVKAYLVAQGVAADRMQTVGYGPDKPVADEKTRKGKIQNRSIQFKLVP